jgi:hypothetical protein
MGIYMETSTTLDFPERDAGADIKLNRFGLELEAERMAELSAYWGAQLADAKKERDFLDMAYDIAKAERAKWYRDNLAKATVDAIKDQVQCDPEVISARTKFMDAEHHVALLYATVDALDKKKSMIETLSKLYLGQYYTKDVASQGHTNHGNMLNQAMNKETRL